MFLGTDDCKKCVNRKIPKGCPYKNLYDKSTKILEKLLMQNKGIEFYGSLRASCDYYVFDKTSEMGVCNQSCNSG